MIWGFLKLGVPCLGSHDTDYGILRSFSGSPDLRKLAGSFLEGFLLFERQVAHGDYALLAQEASAAEASRKAAEVGVLLLL